MNTFEAFNSGKLITPAATKDFSNIAWSKHPTFAGVELKHILTSEETGGAYSYHLVREQHAIREFGATTRELPRQWRIRSLQPCTTY